MAKEYAHIRLQKKTLRNLQRLHGETGEKMIDIMDRLVTEELKRVEFAPSLDADFAPVWPESDWPQPNETDGTTIWPSPKRS